MANLKTDYKDDILDSTQNTRRKFRMITNDDGTFSFEDVTDYLQYGDSFGALDLNAITNAIMNECLKRTDVVDNLESTATDLPASANSVRQVVEMINQDVLVGIDIKHLVQPCGSNGVIRYAKKSGNIVSISFSGCEQNKGDYGFLFNIDESIAPQLSGVFFGIGVYTNENGRDTPVSFRMTQTNGSWGCYCASGSTKVISGSITYYI